MLIGLFCGGRAFEDVVLFEQPNRHYIYVYITICLLEACPHGRVWHVCSAFMEGSPGP